MSLRTPTSWCRGRIQHLIRQSGLTDSSFNAIGTNDNLKLGWSLKLRVLVLTLANRETTE